MNPSGPGLLLVGRLLIAALTSALVIGLFSLNFFLVESWEGASVWEFIHLFPVYWFMCIEFFVVISSGSLYFCGINGDITFIVFNCIYLILSSFLFYQFG